MGPKKPESVFFRNNPFENQTGSQAFFGTAQSEILIDMSVKILLQFADMDLTNNHHEDEYSEEEYWEEMHQLQMEQQHEAILEMFGAAQEAQEQQEIQEHILNLSAEEHVHEAGSMSPAGPQEPPPETQEELLFELQLYVQEEDEARMEAIRELETEKKVQELLEIEKELETETVQQPEVNMDY